MISQCVAAGVDKKLFSKADHQPVRVKNIFIIILAMGLGVFFRINANPALVNIDEVIPHQVINSMQVNADWNTDWSRPEQMPEFFKYPGHGFSSYILSSYVILKISGMDNTVKNLRLLNLIFFALSIILFWFAVVKTIGFDDWITSLTAMLGFALLPGTVFDAWMARPETFLTLLSTLCLYLVVDIIKGSKSHFTLVILGFLIGLGVASKITFGAWGLIALAAMMFGRGFSFKKLLFVGIGGLAGLVLGCPALIVSPMDVFNGILVLVKQYSGFHPPHSLLDYNPFAMLFLQFKYYFLLYGVLFLSPLICLLFLKKGTDSLINDRVLLWSLGTGYVAVFLYLGSRPVFFERNFHFFLAIALFCLIILLRLINNSVAKLTLMFFLLGPLIYWSAVIRAENYTADKVDLDYNQLPLSGFFHPSEISLQAMLYDPIPACGLYSMKGYSDELTSAYREKIAKQGYGQVSVRNGAFHLLPVSTLQTYLSSDHYVFYKQCDKRHSLETAYGSVIEEIGLYQPKSLAMVSAIKYNEWTGSDFYKTSVKGYTTVGSFIQSDNDVGRVVLSVHRGDEILFRSGPVVENQILEIDGLQYKLPNAGNWVLIKFTGVDLPNAFDVELVDSGSGWGEWSAIALKD